jgi:hypothetical protein
MHQQKDRTGDAEVKRAVPSPHPPQARQQDERVNDPRWRETVVDPRNWSTSETHHNEG